MRLVICKNKDPKVDLETTVIPIAMLHMSSVHMFISSNAWEEVVLEVCDEIPDMTLEYMIFNTENMKAVLPEKLSDKSVKQLTSIFPDKAGAIRRAYMTGSPMKGVVPVCEEP